MLRFAQQHSQRGMLIGGASAFVFSSSSSSRSFSSLNIHHQHAVTTQQNNQLLGFTHPYSIIQRRFHSDKNATTEEEASGTTKNEQEQQQQSVKQTEKKSTSKKKSTSSKKKKSSSSEAASKKNKDEQPQDSSTEKSESTVKDTNNNKNTKSASSSSSSNNSLKKEDDNAKKSSSTLPDKSKDKDSNTDDLSLDLEVEPVRWDVPTYSEEIVDEKGQYIVSKFPWKEGELAYTTPAPPAPHEARFGYQVVVVKKPQSYWSWYRRQNFFSWTHLWYQMAFALSVCWLLTWIQVETNFLYDEMRRPGNLAADQLGKGDANRHAKKITVSAEERDEVLQAMQNAFLDGKDLDQKGSKNYRMKKIPRPKEFNAQDYMRG